jgi:hypothetical protein
MLILAFCYLFVFFANYWHWIRCKRTGFMQIPTPGWPQNILVIWVLSFIPVACLHLLDFIPQSFMAFNTLSFCLAFQIYTVFARERQFQQNSKPSDQPVSN